MLYTHNPIIKQKLINLAAALNDVSTACKFSGVPLDIFYRYQKSLQGYIDTRIEKNRIIPTSKNHVDKELQKP